MVDKDAIYFAGFFDGEGYIGLLKRKRSEIFDEYFVQMAIGQKDGKTMDWIKENFGGNIHLVKRDGSYFWIASNRVAYHILKRILPFLKYKRPQAEAAIEFFDGRLGGKKVSPQELERREKIYANLKRLKKVFEKSTYCNSVRVQRLSETTPKGDATV